MITAIPNTCLRFQEFFEQLPRKESKEWILLLALNQTIALADVIVMIAAATARVEYFNDSIERVFNNQENTADALIKTICLATFPVSYLQKEATHSPIANEQSAIVHPETPVHRHSFVAGLDGCSSPHLSWYSTECVTSPNACSILQATSLIPCAPTAALQIYVSSPSGAPPINIRNVDVTRCFKDDTAQGNRGIIGSLACMNDQGYDHSITHHKFSFWPYSMKESNKNDVATCLNVQCRFSHTQILSNRGGGGHVTARLVTLDDIVRLIDLLSIVSINIATV